MEDHWQETSLGLHKDLASFHCTILESTHDPPAMEISDHLFLDKPFVSTLGSDTKSKYTDHVNSSVRIF
jgi:hypothetical protein